MTNRTESSGKNANLLRWFGKSKVIDTDGNPLRVYHGSSKSFKTFDKEFSSVRNFWGKAFYFTNTPDDSNANYANQDGPDLHRRIEEEETRLIRAWVKEHPNQPVPEAELYAKAEKSIVGDSFSTYPVFLRMENPLILGSRGEPKWKMNLVYDDETETYDVVGGRGAAFIEALFEALQELVGESDAGEYFVDIVNEFGEMAREAKENGKPLSFLASDILDSIRHSDLDIDRLGEKTKSELLRNTIQRMGYDGIIDGYTPDRFGTMKGVGENTIHYIVFDACQIKSAIGNKGTYSTSNCDITEVLKLNLGPSQEEAATKVRDIIYKTGDRNALNDRVTVIDGYVVELAPHRGGLCLKYIKAPKDNSGKGSSIIRNILRVADEHGVDVNLVPVPLGDTDHTQDTLRAWYKRIGFVDDGKSGWMIHKAKTSEAFVGKLLRVMEADMLDPFTDSALLEKSEPVLEHILEDLGNSPLPKPFLLVEEVKVSDDDAWKMTSDEFVNHHVSGTIDSNAYRRTTAEGGMDYFTPENYPKLVAKDTVGERKIEFREDPERPGDSLIAFEDKTALGYASNEWGATGVFVTNKAQGLGLGLKLLFLFRKNENIRSRKIGQATPLGKKLIRSYHKLLVNKAVKEGKPVSDEVLNSIRKPEIKVRRNIHSFKALDGQTYSIDHVSNGRRHEFSIRDGKKDFHIALLMVDVGPQALSYVGFQHELEYADFNRLPNEFRETLIDHAEEEFQRPVVGGKVGMDELVLFRGNSVQNKNGNFYSTDFQYAMNFTQTGQRREVSTITIPRNKILIKDPLPLSTDENQFDEAVEEAVSNGFTGVMFAEGSREPNSVYVVRKSGIKRLTNLYEVRSLSQKVLELLS